jgi:2-methylisocitrate lyase-like PEP mutase family enzyme
MIIMARTDANAMMGLDEAIERCKKFREIGADITFLEAPLSEAEMRRYCKEVRREILKNGWAIYPDGRKTL